VKLSFSKPFYQSPMQLPAFKYSFEYKFFLAIIEQVEHENINNFRIDRKTVRNFHFRQGFEKAILSPPSFRFRVSIVRPHSKWQRNTEARSFCIPIFFVSVHSNACIHLYKISHH